MALLLWLQFLLVAAALADVQFTQPAAGSTMQGGTTLQVAWKESGKSPAISTFSTYQLFLMCGGNDASSMIPLGAPLVGAQVPASYSVGGFSAQAVIQTTLAGSAKNAYFLKMVSVSKEGGQVINYSNRFSISGMTGSFPPNVQAAISKLGGSNAGPPTENGAAAANPAVGAGGAAYTVPYTLQTGLTRYAPMASMPPTKISSKNPKPLFPTSDLTIATTFMARPTVVTTLTESQTFSVVSIQNTAAAQTQPTGDMQKYLRRWVD